MSLAYSQDDEARQRRPSAALGSLIPSGGGVSGLSGTPANLGKYTPKSSTFRYYLI